MILGNLFYLHIPYFIFRELLEKFQLKSTIFNNAQDDDCSILSLQNLPNGLYVDLHEIKMKQDKGISKVCLD